MNDIIAFQYPLVVYGRLPSQDAGLGVQTPNPFLSLPNLV